MLLKAEKIISHDDVLIDLSQEEILQLVRRELAGKIVDKLVVSDLLKMEVKLTEDEVFGLITKVSISVRAYNPDD